MATSRDIFDLLGIPPTNDRITVRQAFQLKKLELEKSKDTPLLSELENEYKAVKTKPLLDAYYKAYNRAQAIETASRTGCFTVFIPVPYGDGTMRPSTRRVELERHKDKNFTNFVVPYERIAECINESIKNELFKVGFTEEEVSSDLNSHTLAERFLIVEFKMQCPTSSASEASVEDKRSQPLNFDRQDAVSINKNIRIQSSDILSVGPLKNYLGTVPLGMIQNLDELWPEGKPRIKVSDLTPEYIQLASEELKRLEERNTLFSGDKSKALREAIKQWDLEKIKKALAMKRFPLMDSLFNKRSTMATENVDNKVVVKIDEKSRTPNSGK